MVTNKNLNWGIIGAGNIALKFATDLKKSRNNTLKAVASHSQFPEIIKKKFNIETVYTSYKKLMGNDDIDIIYIATTNNFHYKNILMSIKYKKHVLVEKPITLLKNQTIEIFELANKNNIFVMQAMWTKFFPAIKNLNELLSNNIIGDIKLITADFSIFKEYDKQSRLFNRELGGGATYDLGIYTIMFAKMIAKSNIEKITSNAELSDDKIDTKAQYKITFENGIIANLNCGFLENRSQNATIAGTNGIIEIDNFFHPSSFKLISNKNKTDIIFPFDHQGYLFEIEEVNYCINNKLKESPLMTQKETIQIMDIIEKILIQIGYYNSSDLHKGV